MKQTWDLFALLLKKADEKLGTDYSRINLLACLKLHSIKTHVIGQ